MERTFLSCLLISSTLFAHAQLSPRTDAPLYRHMLEVNAEWRTMDPALANDTHLTHFSDEADRIAMHLHLVEGYLLSHTPEGLSADAVKQRSTLLNDLDTYADQGLFPQNHVLPYRNPVFIDPQGTACAVGQLIIESGHRDLAERISHDMNLAYVHAMHRADMDEWASAHGFTENELAWIQPSYPPTTVWDALGGGTNGTVNVLLETDDGNLVVAGDFTQAGGSAFTNVVLWDGSSFIALGSGVAGTITCGAVIGNDIYLGGSGLGGNNDLAHWNGTQWSYSSVFAGKFPQMFALHVHAGNLYAAGASLGFAGTNYYVQRLNGDTWQNVGGNFNGAVTALGSHDSYIVAGGSFTGTTGGSGITAMHVAEFGAAGWAQVGDGLDASVHALLDVDGTLYAGGDLYANVAPLFGLARIGESASSWEQLMPGLASYITANAGVTEVRALTTDGEYVYIGGGFTMTQFTVYGSSVVRFLGTPDSFTPMADFNAPVDAFAHDNNGSSSYDLIAGGDFTQNMGQDLPHLARMESLPTDIPENTSSTGPKLYPNPVDDHLTIVSDASIPNNAKVMVADAAGRTVIASTLNGPSTTLDVSHLKAGAYVLHVEVERGERTSAFVKR